MARTSSSMAGGAGIVSLCLYAHACLAPVPPDAAGEVLVGAGDIASCISNGDEATAALLDAIDGTVFTLGDNAYPHGSNEDFGNCYHRSWGRHAWRTRPAVGNHEYESPNATPHFTYFGANAGDPARGYYSYQVGNWHIVVINSVIDVSIGSPQEQWLRADLAAHPAPCTAAYWHYPRFSSGQFSVPAMQPIWQALYDAGAEVVISGHEHFYERFAPQTPDGRPDPVRGIRQFIVGTGGVGHFRFGTIAANSQARNSHTYGVLKLTLRAEGYDWRFIPVSGEWFEDRGTGTCH